MASVSVENLEQGMILAADVRDPLGRLLVAEGTVVTDRHSQILKKWGIHVVEVQADQEDGRADITPEILEKAQHLTRDRFRLCDLEHPCVAELLLLATDRAARRLAAEVTGGS
jgi:hypothetical protein